MIKESLKALKLPALDYKNWPSERENIKRLILEEEYGTIPEYMYNTYIKEEIKLENQFAGKAVMIKIRLAFDTEKGSFSFPVNIVKPKDIKKGPAIINIAFRRDIPDIYYPTEEILDQGFIVASFCYEDISADNLDFTSGLAIHFDRNKWTWGKIGMWAFAAMRLVDILMSLDYVDKERIAFVGHSRLGKTALLAGALDDRVNFVFSNNSGSSGAALSRGKRGERVKDITDRFPYWFCENYKKHAGKEEQMPFDQHFLLSLIYPRNIYVASSIQDTWADPKNEFLSLAATDPLYKNFAYKGLVCPNRLPLEGDVFNKGNLGYHLRSGTHYLSRYDWQRFMDFMLKF